MICTFSACHHKTTSSGGSGSSSDNANPPILDMVADMEVEDNRIQSNDNDAVVSDPTSEPRERGRGDGESQRASREVDSDMINVLQATQQSISVQSEHQSLICRALQCQWLLIKQQIGT
jgi:hypothetical protein